MLVVKEALVAVQVYYADSCFSNSNIYIG